MLTTTQQVDVWEGLILSATRARLFASLCNRYKFCHKLLLGATLLCSFVAASFVFKEWLPQQYAWVRVVLTIATAGFSFLSVIQQYQKSSFDCLDLYYRWSQLASQYDALWNDMYVSTAESLFKSLQEKRAEASKASVPFGEQKRLMSKWQRYVEDEYCGRYKSSAVSTS